MNVQKQDDFAAFIMTSERPGILLSTISKLQSQTLAPALILVVDNSESYATETAVRGLSSPEIEYFRVGFNSGPAGAALIGLQQLTKKGYKWLYWGDDDNPPRDNGVFEELFKKIAQLGKENIPIGIFSGKGGYLNKLTGRLRSLSNSELAKAKILEVDAVPGGHTMLVNAEIVKKGILPIKKLFFGFEELEFCLSLKNTGYRIFIDAQTWLQARHKANNTHKDYRWKDTAFGKCENFDREYYSTRNLLYIFWKHKLYFAFLFFLIKVLIKLFAGYWHGLHYGKKNFRAQGLALLHFFMGRYDPLKNQPEYTL
ncbi:MAG TPA: glycosyltransferase [Salinimicrobium sp.]|nr:glycosyltransferase [Salinimicrobium sp.]